jgi:hypothetical protein
MNPFTRRSTAAWYKIGLASELPNLDDDGQRVAPKCKAFTIPTNGPMKPVEDIDLPGELKDQVLVFKYKGKYHAIDHVSETPNSQTVSMNCAHVTSNAPTRLSHYHKEVSLILKISASSSVLESHVLSTTGLLTYFPVKQIAVNTNSRCGRCSCVTQHLGVLIRRSG